MVSFKIKRFEFDLIANFCSFNQNSHSGSFFVVILTRHWIVTSELYDRSPFIALQIYNYSSFLSILTPSRSVCGYKHKSQTVWLLKQISRFFFLLLIIFLQQFHIFDSFKILCPSFLPLPLLFPPPLHQSKKLSFLQIGTFQMLLFILNPHFVSRTKSRANLFFVPSASLLLPCQRLSLRIHLGTLQPEVATQNQRTTLVRLQFRLIRRPSHITFLSSFFALSN
jgi:hypothetical protein